MCKAGGAGGHLVKYRPSSLKDRIVALEREVRKLKSVQKSPPPPPDDGENRSYGQYL